MKIYFFAMILLISTLSFAEDSDNIEILITPDNTEVKKMIRIMTDSNRLNCREVIGKCCKLANKDSFYFLLKYKYNKDSKDNFTLKINNDCTILANECTDAYNVYSEMSAVDDDYEDDFLTMYLKEEN